MTTYSLIIKNILKTDNNNYFFKYKNDGVNSNLKLVFSILLNKQITVKNKFNFFNDTLKGFPIKNILEKEFIEYFCKIQKIYNILNRFAYNYKYKKAKIIVNNDMCLNELDIKNKNVICILHNNSKYLFHINDLIKIINSALTNSDSFFSYPKSVKNPYNNMPFNKSTLYNIYFFIKYKTHYYPELFDKFFYVNFNLSIFKNNNEYLLRDYAIKNYVYKSPSDTLNYEIQDMIIFFNDYCRESKLKNRIKIDKDFPKDRLIKIMQPYLLLYFMANYAYLKHVKNNALYFFKKSLLLFNIFNPQFGRKRYKILIKYENNFDRKICGKLIEFDDTHIKFNSIKKQSNFLSDHLLYEDVSFLINENYFYQFFYFSLSDEDINENEEDEEDNEDEDNEDNEDEDNEDINENVEDVEDINGESSEYYEISSESMDIVDNDSIS